jgi:hypothetical protein
MTFPLLDCIVLTAIITSNPAIIISNRFLLSLTKIQVTTRESERARERVRESERERERKRERERINSGWVRR